MGLKDFKKAMAKVDEQDLVPKEDAAKSFKDDRFWLPTFDDTGVAKATIRFLGNPKAGESPYILDLQHSYSVPTADGKSKKWLIDRCSWTIKKPCAYCQYVNEVGYDNIKGLAKKKFYLSNILVIKDEVHPENEGKVFLYKFGSQIFNTITQCQKGYTTVNEDGDEVEIKSRKVFDFDKGHDFNINVYKKMADGKDQNQYDKCKFKMKASAVANGDDEEQEKIYNAMTPFDEFLDPAGFPTEEEANKKLTNFFKRSTESKGSSENKEEKPKAETTKSKNLAPTETSKEDEADDFFDSLDEEDEIPY